MIIPAKIDILCIINYIHGFIYINYVYSIMSKTLKEHLITARLNQANYQPVMIRTLLKSNMPITKQTIIDDLYNENLQSGKSNTHYKTCEVFRVLCKIKNIVSYDKDTKLFTLNFVLDESLRLELIALCDHLIAKSNSMVYGIEVIA